MTWLRKPKPTKDYKANGRSHFKNNHLLRGLPSSTFTWGFQVTCIWNSHLPMGAACPAAHFNVIMRLRVTNAFIYVRMFSFALCVREFPICVLPLGSFRLLYPVFNFLDVILDTANDYELNTTKSSLLLVTDSLKYCFTVGPKYLNIFTGIL